MKNADRCRIIAVVVELGRVMQHQNRRVIAGQPFLSRLKVPLQNLCFIDLLIRKEAIGSLRVGPVLTCPRNARPYTARELLHQLSKSFVQPHIAKLASHQLRVNPSLATPLPLLSHSGASLTLAGFCKWLA